MAAKLSAEGAVQNVRFGNFEVMNDSDGRPVMLGKGTFGRTYKARHCFLDTIVALKIITGRYVTDAAVRQRFLTEARAVAKLSHPHIARLYDFGEMDGMLHYAMEYCGGGSLADYVAKNGPLPLRRTIEITQQISGALKCAHTAGFIHRDLKPSNIMLTAPDGPPFAKLIDFGLVQPSVPGATRSFSEDQSADGARFLGTPLFASPEQLREEPMDVRTDLFSLGMTLWFLMAGRAPESGSSAEIAASRLNRENYAARLPANLPPPFADVLRRLLEKDRKNRFATAADVFKALNACAAALGFRRARDYTDPAAALEWEDAEATESGALDFTKLEPAELEPVEGELASEFNIMARINEDFTGLNYVAEEVGKKGAISILHVVHRLLLEDASAIERFRVHIAQLMRADVAEIVRPKAIKRYSDLVAVISDKPGGTDLLSVLRTEGTMSLIEAAPLLEKIADACDRLCAAGLPGAQLAPGRIFVESATDGLSKAQVRLCPRFLAVNEAPELARMNEPEDARSTMTTDMLGDPGRADNMAEHFASLLYRVVAGRNCPVAVSLSTQAYVAIPSLSEQSNRILAMVIARQVEDSSCGKVLREILNAEGIIPRVPGHSSAGFTERPGSSTVSPAKDAAMRPQTASEVAERLGAQMLREPSSISTPHSAPPSSSVASIPPAEHTGTTGDLARSDRTPSLTDEQRHSIVEPMPGSAQPLVEEERQPPADASPPPLAELQPSTEPPVTKIAVEPSAPPLPETADLPASPHMEEAAQASVSEQSAILPEIPELTHSPPSAESVQDDTSFGQSLESTKQASDDSAAPLSTDASAPLTDHIAVVLRASPSSVAINIQRLRDGWRDRANRRLVLWVLSAACVTISLGATTWFLVRPRPSPAPVTAGPPAPAGVDLTSNPTNAKVFVGRTLIGTTPLRRSDLRPGDAMFYIAVDGFLPQARRVKLVSGKTNTAGATLARPAPAYYGIIAVEERPKSGGQHLKVELGEDLRSGVMTQVSRHGGTIATKFSAMWDGTTLRGVTGEEIFKAPGVRWQPEAFGVVFSDDGKSGAYKCVANGLTYTAALSSEPIVEPTSTSPVSATFKGIIRRQDNSRAPQVQIIINFDASGLAGTITRLVTGGSLTARFTAVKDGETLHAVASELITKPKDIKWAPEGFTIRFAPDRHAATYESLIDGHACVAQLADH